MSYEILQPDMYYTFRTWTARYILVSRKPGKQLLSIYNIFHHKIVCIQVWVWESASVRYGIFIAQMTIHSFCVCVWFGHWFTWSNAFKCNHTVSSRR